MREFIKCLVFLLCFSFVFPASGATDTGIVINELVAAGSDRLLQRDGSGCYPKLGITTPWFMQEYDDDAWSAGLGPFGFGSFSSVVFGVNTSSEMQGKVPSLYLRGAFEVPVAIAPMNIGLRLNIRYNDGFIAFINGVEVARRNMGNSAMFAYHDQNAFNPHDDDVTEAIVLGTCAQFLQPGTNLLSIQIHNQDLTGDESSSLLLMAELEVDTPEPFPLVEYTDEWKYFVGVVEPSGGVVDYALLEEDPITVPWGLPGFNDSAWIQTPGPVGYERSVPAYYVLGTNLVAEMYGITPSVYARTLFSVSEGEASSSLPLSLEIDYDDAIIVYLNGVEVARRNIGTANTVTPYSDFADAGHSANNDGGSTVAREEIISLAAANTLLLTGDNILAIQVHNSSLTSSDMIGRVELRTTGPASRVLATPEDICRFFVGIAEPVSVTPDDDSEVIDETPDSDVDWLELYNAGSNAVDITGWSLTDDDDSPEKWFFPTGSVIEAGGYLVVMADGLDIGPEEGAMYLHAKFKLDKKGEYVGLFDSNGSLVDELSPGYPEQLPFYCYARDDDGTLFYCDKGTPGSANTGAYYDSILPSSSFSKEGGFYPSGTVLQLSVPVRGGMVQYTVDGSEPTLYNGSTYRSALTLYASAVVRARTFKSGYIPSPIITHTYLINQAAGLQSVAAICVNSDPTLSIYGPNAVNGPADGEGILSIKGGIYDIGIWSYNGDTSAFNIPNQHGRAFEKPSSLEFLPVSGNPLRTDFGLRVSGSRHLRPRYLLQTDPALRFPDNSRHKPSFNFFFRNELGESPLDYPFFPDNSVTKFGDLRLRAGKNDIKNPYIKDELARRIFIATGQKGSHGIFNTLYLNGVYKGYYNLCEHLREAFMQEHFNSENSWDVRQVGEFANGDALHWNSMITYLRSTDLSTLDGYAGVSDFLDVDNYIDYLIVNTFGATWDWPNNNWVASRERAAAGRWRFFVWDAEGAFRSDRDPAAYDSFDRDLDIGSEAMSTTSKWIPAIYTLLKVSPEFRLRFADRVQKHAFHSGAMTQGSMTAQYEELRTTINPVMQATNGETVNQTFYNNWIATDTRRNTWFGQLTSYGLWIATVAPEFSQHGGIIAEGSSISIINPNPDGVEYYTVDDSDPRSPGGAVAGSLYSTSLVANISFTLKARVLRSSGVWSPLQEAFFQVPVDLPEFLPEGSADWTTDSNWNSTPAPYPNGVDARALIHGPPTANREVSIRAPVTIAEIQFDMNGCLFRNRVRDRDEFNTLTFESSSGPALLSVDGEGPGYVEFEVESDIFLNSSLQITVNNTMGDSDYGALRLRENWSGTGGIIKEGPGVLSMTGDSKSYTGSTIVNQGVLQISEPASPRQSTLLSVNTGGQLRLSSSGTAEKPRIYYFGGLLMLGSCGRGGELPDVPGLGVKGGLRYDPGGSDSYATLSNGISFTAASCIHVEGSENSLSIPAPLYGAYGFVKTGGGMLLFDSIESPYFAPVTVSNGTMVVNRSFPAPLDIAEEGTLSGYGHTGPLQGEGSVALNGTILRSSSAVGLNYALSFSQSGSPLYMNSAASGNSLLRLTSIQSGAHPSNIDIYLDTPSLAAGDLLRGGIFVEGGNGLAEFLAQATVAFYVPDLAGSRSFDGRNWSLYTGSLPVAATAMPETADFGDGPRFGHIIELRVAGPAVTFDGWVQLCFTNPVDRTDPAVAGPLACPSGDGTANLTRYAFDMDPYESAPERLPAFSIEDGVPHYEFSFDPGKNDLTTFVEADLSLNSWTRTLFDSRTDDLSRWNGERVHILDAESGPPIHSNQFYRLRIQLAE